jgi:putative PIN family toxin of toxin-antitoxin system
VKAGPAVIDTNVVVSGVLTKVSQSPTVRILDGMLAGRFRFLLSVELIAEYREVLLRPKIRRRHGLSAAEIDILLTEIVASGAVLDLASPANKERKRGGDHLWRILAAAPPAILVTGDQKLIEKPAKGVRVLTARAFAETLESV